MAVTTSSTNAAVHRVFIELLCAAERAATSRRSTRRLPDVTGPGGWLTVQRASVHRRPRTRSRASGRMLRRALPTPTLRARLDGGSGGPALLDFSTGPKSGRGSRVGRGCAGEVRFAKHVMLDRERRLRADLAPLGAFREMDPFRFGSLSGRVFQTALRQHHDARGLHVRSLDRIWRRWKSLGADGPDTS
jgi:hypothetical protein